MAIDPELSDLSEFAAHIGQATTSGGKADTVVDDDLVRLWTRYNDYVSNHGNAEGFKANALGMPISGSTVTVDVTADGSGASLLGALKGIGLEHATSFGKIVSGELSIDKIDDLAKLPGVHSAAEAYVVTNAGSVMSQGDAAMKADDARAAFGVDGTGIKIGVLSDSFDTGPGSYAADKASGDLPAGVTILADSAGGTDEGRAMAQLIYDVAPNSSLAFHTAAGGQASFAQAIVDLKNAGADVIVDDAYYPHEPMFLDGVVAQAVNQVAAAGVAYFSSAGNDDVRSYEAAYRPMTAPAGLTLPYAYQSLHDFNPAAGTDSTQGFTLGAGKSALLSFQWADPFFTHTGVGASTDLDILVYDTAGNLVAISDNPNVGADPYEIVQVTNTTGATKSYNLVIAKYEGPDPSHIKYIDFGSANFSEYKTDSGTSFGHSSADGGEGVGAAYYQNTPEFGTTPPVLESFSSAGGTPILYSTSGARLASPVIRDRVDITAPDGTDTTFFGSDSDGNGHPNFFGTSAAAPHAAAVAALMLDAKGTLTPTQIYDALESKAIDMDNPYAAGFQTGKDIASGYGLIDANASVGAVAGGGGGTPTPGNDIITGTTGPDTIYALAGDDTVYGKAGNDYLDGGPGLDKLYGDDGNDKLFGQDGNDLMYGGAGADELGGQAGNDTMYGEAGADKLGGGTGNDILNGGTENDTLSGRDGLDNLTGGAGNDIFDYDAVTDSKPGATLRDVINDFVGVGAAVGDRIDLSTIDANTTKTGNQAFAFKGTAAFSGAGQVHVLASGANTLVQANTDANKATVELEILVKDGAALPTQWVAGDFIL